MQQSKTRNIYGLILLSAALLQFVLLVASMVTSVFFLGGHGMQLEWPSLLLALVLLGIAAVGVYQIRTPRETTPVSQRISVAPGFGLGIILAILLYLPGLGIMLTWAAFGLPMLIGILLQNPSGIATISPLLALISTALYAIFAIRYSICVYQVTRRGGSVKQGMWSCILEVMATFLGTALTFSFIDMVAYFFFHTGSGLVAPSSWPGVSPLVNYIASYQGSVQSMAIWLLTPVIVGLLIALVSSFISRRTSRPAPVQTN